MPHKRKKINLDIAQPTVSKKPNVKLNPPDIYDIHVINSPDSQSPENTKKHVSNPPLPSHYHLSSIPDYLHNQAASTTTTSVVTTTSTTITRTSTAYQPLMSCGIKVSKPSSIHSEPPIPTYSSSEYTDNSYSSSEEASESGTPSPPIPLLSPSHSTTPDSKVPPVTPSTAIDNQVPLRSIPSIYIYTPDYNKETIARIQAVVKPPPQFKLHRDSLECLPRTSATHRQTLALLADNSIEHHSMNEKLHRPVKLAIKYVPTEISQAEIAADLEANHLSFLTISRIMQTRNGTKSPSNILIISTTQAQIPRYNNLHTLCNILVTVEKYIRKDIPQCHRCQGFGHSSQLCRRTHKCVKCGRAHAGAPCEAVACKCANCGAGHPASYRGCPVYLETRARFLHNNSNNTNISSSSNSQTPPNHLSFATPLSSSTPTVPYTRELNPNATPFLTSNPPSTVQPTLPTQADSQPQPSINEPNIIQTIIDVIKSFNLPHIIHTIRTIVHKINAATNPLDKIIILLELITSIL